jgi:hypothetical protein
VLSPLAGEAVLVIDMNGNVVKRWEGLQQLRGGRRASCRAAFVVGQRRASAAPGVAGARPAGLRGQGRVAVSPATNRSRRVTAPRIWSARQHHDWQRESFPAGYYSPDTRPAIEGGNTLILTHADRNATSVADVPLEDDRLIEVSSNGDIVWEWVASDHIDELGFSPDARKAIKAGSGVNAARGSFDWLHVNSATYVGPNRWFDQGDRRFTPTNVIISSREASLLAIVGRDGSIVWRLGPDFTESKELRAIRQIIGQHHAHLIPKGLPGAGNLLVFDNGGASGYGFTNPIAPDGRGAFARATSRVLEINPVTLELVWSYTNPAFFSTNISGAQRLPNGKHAGQQHNRRGRRAHVRGHKKRARVSGEYMYPFFARRQRRNASTGLPGPVRLDIPQLTRRPRRAEDHAPPPLGDFRVR